MAPGGSKNGYAWVNEKPGWGIEVDEALAAKHPITDEHPNEFRTPDGALSRAPVSRGSSCMRHAAVPAQCFQPPFPLLQVRDPG